jgi:hypothetical protein
MPYVDQLMHLLLHDAHWHDHVTNKSKCSNIKRVFESMTGWASCRCATRLRAVEESERHVLFYACTGARLRTGMLRVITVQSQPEDCGGNV